MLLLEVDNPAGPDNVKLAVDRNYIQGRGGSWIEVISI